MFNSFCNSACGCSMSRLQAAADAVPTRRYAPVQQNRSACGCGCGNSCGGACTDARYFGYPNQEVAPGDSLLLSRYFPPEDAESSEAICLPCGRYLVTYSVNASAAEPGASDTVTLGVAPVVNGVAFPRGGSFATVPDDGSGTLASTFMICLPRAVNTVGFYNTGALRTSYQLLNVSVTRVC